MNNYSELVRQMAESFVEAVRELETEINKLRSENESLRLLLRELRESTDTYHT